MRADAILFDKDGTLFDFQATWAPWLGEVIAGLAAGDAPLAAALARVWGYDRARGDILPGSIVIAGEVGDIADAAVPLVPGHDGASLLDHLIETSAVAQAVEVLPLAGFLGALKGQGLTIGLGTNDAEAVARAQLARLGVEGLFGFIAGFDSGHGGKPAPGMCTAFVAHAGVAPERAVMVGDSAHDLVAGRAAGMQTVAVLTGVAAADELAPFADAVLADIGDLPGWLAG